MSRPSTRFLALAAALALAAGPAAAGPLVETAPPTGAGEAWAGTLQAALSPQSLDQNAAQSVLSAAFSFDDKNPAAAAQLEPVMKQLAASADSFSAASSQDDPERQRVLYQLLNSPAVASRLPRYMSEEALTRYTQAASAYHQGLDESQRKALDASLNDYRNRLGSSAFVDGLTGQGGIKTSQPDSELSSIVKLVRNRDQNMRWAAFLVDPANPGRAADGSFRPEYVRALKEPDAVALKAYLTDFSQGKTLTSAPAFGAWTLLRRYDETHNTADAAPLYAPTIDGVLETLSDPSSQWKAEARRAAIAFFDQALSSQEAGDRKPLKTFMETAATYEQSGDVPLAQDLYGTLFGGRTGAARLRRALPALKKAGAASPELAFLAALGQRLEAARGAEDRLRLGYGESYRRAMKAEVGAAQDALAAFQEARLSRRLTKTIDLKAIEEALRQDKLDEAARLLSQGHPYGSLFLRREELPPSYEEIVTLKKVDEIAGFHSKGRAESLLGYKEGYLESLSESEVGTLSSYLEGYASGRYNDARHVREALQALERNDAANHRGAAAALEGPVFDRALKQLLDPRYGEDSMSSVRYLAGALIENGFKKMREGGDDSLIEKHALTAIRSLYDSGDLAGFLRVFKTLYPHHDSAPQWRESAATLAKKDLAGLSRDIELSLLGFLAVRMDSARDYDDRLRGGHGYHNAEGVSKEAAAAASAARSFALSTRMPPSHDAIARANADKLPAEGPFAGIHQSALTANVDWWVAEVGFLGLRYDSSGRRWWGDNIQPGQLLPDFAKMDPKVQDAYRRSFGGAKDRDPYEELTAFMTPGDPKLAQLFERHRPKTDSYMSFVGRPLRQRRAPDPDAKAAVPSPDSEASSDASQGGLRGMIGRLLGR